MRNHFTLLRRATGAARLGTLLLTLPGLALLALPAQAQAPTVAVTPAGPLTLCAGSTQTLTATTTVAGFNVAGSGFNGTVFAVVVLPDGKVLVGGQFSSYNGNANAPDHLVRLNADGTLDTSFNNGANGVDAYVEALAVQPDGKVLVGGGFTNYNGSANAPEFMLRLNADGTLDTSFNPGGTGANSPVLALALQADGKVLAGGDFSTYNGSSNAPDYVLRLNANGSLDTSFNNGATTGTNAGVRTLAVQADGKVLVGGGFISYNGNANAPDRVLRLNADGSLDTSFNNGATAGTNASVRALVVQPDGKVLVGGDFASYNGNAAAPDRMLRLNTNGSLDTSFNTAATGANDDVYAVAMQPDGKVLAGGIFTAYNGNTNAPDRVLRLNADGTLDTSFNNGATAGANNYVVVLTVQANGKVLVGGNITAYNGNAAAPNGLLRLNADGSLNDATTVPAGLAYTWSNGATGPSITVSQPGDYQATTTANGTGYSNVVRLNAPPIVAVQVTPAGPLALPAGGSAMLTATALLPGFNVAGAGLDSRVTAVAVQADGKVLVGGSFTSYNGNAAAPDYVLRLNADGSLDTSFNSGGDGADNLVRTLVLQPDGKVLVGGDFTNYNGSAAAPNRVLRLNADGSLDTSFNSGGTGTPSNVYALALQPDGKVLVGGEFSSYNGSMAAPDRVLRLNADGTLDTSFNSGGSGANNNVYALVVQPDGKVLVGGDFAAYNSAAAPDRIMRLNADGTLDTSFNTGGTGAGTLVRTLALQPDGQVLVGGDFTSYNGSTVAPDYVLRLNDDGTLDTGFNSGGAGTNGIVYALAVQADGKVLVGGSFTSYNGSANAPDYVLRLGSSGSLDTGFNNGATAGANGIVYALAVQADGKVLVGGGFTGYNGNPAAPDRLLRLNANGSPNDAATPLAGATFVFTPGNTAGATRTVSTTGTYTATATDPATGCAYPSNAVVVTVAAAADLVISTGTAAAPIAIAADTYNSITVTNTGFAILGGAVVVNSAVSINGSLNTSCQALTGAGTFTLAAGATLVICDVNGISPSGAGGAVQTSGVRSFSTDANYVYTATQAQIVGTGLPATVRNLTNATSGGDLFLTQPVAIRQVLALPTTSNLNLNNQALTLLSDASGTALVANTGGGQVLGNTATLQRHIETNTASGGYRHYASPMVATAGAETLATLATTGYAPDFSGAAAYNSSATPGLVTPFPTVFLYNQDRIAGTASTYDPFSKGWQAVLGTEVPQVGRGYSVQAPGAALVDFTGTLTSGSVSRSNLQRASADPATGWHLLGNPFPSPLDWSTMSVGTTTAANLQDIDGAVYVFESSGPYVGAYRTYLAAAPGQGSPIIPAGSGFFVHTTAPATPGTVRFAGANRVTTFDAQPAFGRGTAEVRPRLTLALRGTGGLDALTVYADPAATPAFDAAYDALKLPNPTGLNLSAQAGPAPLAIDALPAFASGTVVPLTVGVPAAGTYALQVSELLNLPAGTTAVLVDVELNTRTDLATLPAAGYAFAVSPVQATALLTARFSLNLSAAGPLATAAGRTTTTVQLYPNPARSTATLTGAQPGTLVTVYDALGRSVTFAPADATGTAALVLPYGLAAGVYVVRAGSTALRLAVE